MATALTVHTHTWIDPTEQALRRRPKAPIIGPEWGAMKAGKRYVCRECGLVLHTPATLEPGAKWALRPDDL